MISMILNERSYCPTSLSAVGDMSIVDFGHTNRCIVDDAPFHPLTELSMYLFRDLQSLFLLLGMYCLHIFSSSAAPERTLCKRQFTDCLCKQAVSRALSSLLPTSLYFLHFSLHLFPFILRL